MEDLSKTPFLLRRSGRCYFRIRVPSDLVDVLSRKEIKVSLGTSDLREAKEKIGLELLKAQELFASSRREASPPTLVSPQPERLQISEFELERIALLWFKEQEQQSEQCDLSNRLIMDQEQTFDLIDNLRDDLAALESGEESIFSPAVQPVADKILKKSHVVIDKGYARFPKFDCLIHRGLVQLTYNRLARLGDQYPRQPDSFFEAQTHPLTTQQDIVSKEITWGELVKSFTRAQESDGLSKKTRAGYNLITEFSTEFFGNTTALSTITGADCRALKDKLSQLPSNAKKRHPNLTLIQAAENGSKDDPRSLSSTSINNQIRNLSTIFNFAIGEGYITQNPTSNVKKIKSQASDKEDRTTYTIDELNRLFSTPLYTGCIDDKRNYRKPGNNHPRGHRFWISLISLFTGMRLNECCQLFAEDIYMLEGIPIIHVRRDSNGEKTLKNDGSERIIPIHPTLQQIGW